MKERLRTFRFDEVVIKNGLFHNRIDINKSYLKELDDTALLQNYYFEAGIIIPGMMTVSEPEKTNLHWGWEAPTCQLRGHFLGHYMSAAAAVIANEKDEILEAKLRHIVSELRRCQLANGGRWAASIPEKYFEIMTTGVYIWSPQYTVHKLLMGLLDTYKYTGNKEALVILSGMADWFIDWTKDMKKRSPKSIYDGEQAGMLEVWADAYIVTGDEKYKTLADIYKDQGIFTLLRQGKDALTDEHANASIPIIQGAAKMYEMTKDDDYRKIVEAFWDQAVTKRGMYATTGANAGEFWIPPQKLGEYRGDRGQEFCTVYNMVRVALYLFSWTGNSEYCDYIERCIYNGFLAQQSKETGMPAYFLQMTTGSKKKWASKRRDFWCCQGTMIQSATKYPRIVYSADDENNTLYVNQYIPSKLTGKLGSIDISLDQSLLMSGREVQSLFEEHSVSEKSRWKMSFKVEAGNGFTLALRIPGWISAKPVITVNGKEIDIEELKTENGYAFIEKVKANDEIYIFLPSEVKAQRLPDMNDMAAFVDGPIVLAGLTEEIDTIRGDFDKPEEFMYKNTEHVYDVFVWLQNNYRTKHQPKNINMIPLYEVNDEAYTIYFEEVNK